MTPVGRREDEGDWIAQGQLPTLSGRERIGQSASEIGRATPASTSKRLSSFRVSDTPHEDEASENSKELYCCK